MIFLSRRRYSGGTSRCESAPEKPLWGLRIIFSALILGLIFEFYVIGNSFNPSSAFCSYKIYKQPDGTYQVWWKGRFSRLEFSCKTYEEAKKFQVDKCDGMYRFISQKPEGKRVK